MNSSPKEAAWCRPRSWRLHFNSKGPDRHRASFESAGLLAQRLQQLRLDPEYMQVCHPSVYKELEQVCAACRFQRICALDLASGDVQSGLRIYCPNAPVIDALTVNWTV
jgi:hypothetical protein